MVSLSWVPAFAGVTGRAAGTKCLILTPSLIDAAAVEAVMISRIISTAVLVLLSGSAFFAQATFALRSDGGMFLVLGVLCLGLSVLNWFVWEAVREGWNYGRGTPKDGPGLPVAVAFGPVFINGLLRTLGAPEPDKSEAAAPSENRSER
jgi:hypothetical protein